MARGESGSTPKWALIAAIVIFVVAASMAAGRWLWSPSPSPSPAQHAAPALSQRGSGTEPMTTTTASPTTVPSPTTFPSPIIAGSPVKAVRSPVRVAPRPTTVTAHPAAVTPPPRAAEVPSDPVVRPTHSVPATIASDCSRPVERELVDFFATVPDGATILFPPNGCYGYAGTIVVDDRHGLTFEGRGSVFRALTQGGHDRAALRFNGASRLVLRDVTIRGAHPDGGVHEGAYVPSLEGQHGIGLGSIQGALVENVTVADVYGDFVAVQWDWRLADNVAAAAPARDVVIRNLRAERNGRQGVFVGHAERVTLERSYLGDTRQNAVDLEPDIPEHLARDVRIVGNRFGPTRFTLLAATSGSGASVGNVTFAGNRMDAASHTCWPAIVVEGRPNDHKVGWTVEDNHLHQAVPYWRSAFDFAHVGNVVVRRNVVPLSSAGGCDRTVSGVWLSDTRDVGVSENRFNGAQAAVVKDDRCRAVAETGNTV